jgi:hypothetical protein
LKLKSVLKFGGILAVVGKPSASKMLIEFISQLSEIRCGSIDF